MDFIGLQNALRTLVLERIHAGHLTGLGLARETGFRQAHISNFLNRRRGLSVEAMDRILRVLDLSVLDLLDPAEINSRATVPPPAEGDYENVVLVDHVAAISQPVITRSSVLEILKFKKSFLRRMRADLASPREGWIRFVLVKADPGNAMAMQPRITPGATLLIDRHYNSMRPYRRSGRNVYAIHKAGNLLIRYAELEDSQLLLRPHNEGTSLNFVTVAGDKSFADYIVGRVCHIASET